MRTLPDVHQLRRAPVLTSPSGVPPQLRPGPGRPLPQGDRGLGGPPASYPRRGSPHERAGTERVGPRESRGEFPAAGAGTGIQEEARRAASCCPNACGPTGARREPNRRPRDRAPASLRAMPSRRPCSRREGRLPPSGGTISTGCARIGERSWLPHRPLTATHVADIARADGTERGNGRRSTPGVAPVSGS